MTLYYASFPSQETTFLYIPNSAVGAIIGTRGSHIRNIIRFSGASVKITSLPEGTSSEPQAERKVTIVGTPEAQWKVNLSCSVLIVIEIDVIMTEFQN